MLQQSHESCADINVMLRDRKAFRTNDVMLNNMQQVPLANHSGRRHAASGNQMVAQDAEYASRNVHRRNPSGIQHFADGNRVMVQHDERAYRSQNIPSCGSGSLRCPRGNGSSYWRVPGN
jgi:hypothetical protein